MLQGVARYGTVQMVKMLLKAGACPNTSVSTSALSSAVSRKGMNMMHMLLVARALATAADVSAAVSTNNHAKVRVSIGTGAYSNVDAKTLSHINKFIVFVIQIHARSCV